MPEDLPDLSDFLSLSSPEVPREVARYVAETFGDSAALLLLDIDGLHLHPTAIHPPPPEEQALLDVSVSLMEVRDHTFSRAIFERRTVTMSTEEWTGIVPMAGDNLAATPVKAADEVIGVLLAASDDPFSGEELRTLEFLASQAGAALLIAERYADSIWRARRRHTASLAAQVQNDLLPPQEQYTDGFSMAGRIEPTYDIGGDWYDYALIDDELYVAVADVSGKGLEAEHLANTTFGAARKARRDRESLPGIASAVDRVMNEISSRGDFVTMLLARVNPETREMELVHAGHPAPVLIPADPDKAASFLPISRRHPPAGVAGPDEELSFEAEKYQLESGSSLLFYTDGVTERRDEEGDFIGEEGLLRLVENSRGLDPLPFVHDLLQGVVNHGDNPIKDDATVVFVRIEDAG